jgi:hypothetical protein
MRIYTIVSEPELSSSAAYSLLDESVPIAYFSEHPQCKCPRMPSLLVMTS